MAERISRDILSSTFPIEEDSHNINDDMELVALTVEGNAKEDKVNNDTESVALTEEDVSGVIFTETLTNPSSGSLSVTTVDFTKELVELKDDESGRSTADSVPISTLSTKGISENLESTVTSKPVSSEVSAGNEDSTKNSELVAQKDESKTDTSKALLDDNPVDNYPSGNIIFCDADSASKAARAEAVAKQRSSSEERNRVLKMHLRSSRASRTDMGTFPDINYIRELCRKTLSEVGSKTIADEDREKVDAQTQTDEDFGSLFRHAEECGNAAAAASSSHRRVAKRSNSKSLTDIDFNDSPLPTGRNRRSLEDTHRSLSVLRTPIKWEDVKISWQQSTVCHSATIKSLGKDDPISRTFSEMYDYVDQEMDNLRLWESKFSNVHQEFPSDILRQEPDDTPSMLLKPIVHSKENPTIEGLKPQSFKDKNPSKSTDRSLKLGTQTDQEAPTDNSPELYGACLPSSSNLAELPQESKYFSKFAFPALLIDKKQPHCESDLKNIDYNIWTLTDSNTESLDTPEEVGIRRQSERSEINFYPTSSDNDSREKPSLNPTRYSPQGSPAVITSDTLYSRVGAKYEIVVHSYNSHESGEDSEISDENL